MDAQRAPGAPRVLVGDDSPVIRRLISLNLALEGFAVTLAEDGTEALRLARAMSPDVVTLDVMMPGLTGFEVLEQLRSDPDTRHIPVVLVTGRAQGSDLAHGEELGADAYLTKPFEPTELVEVVARLARSGRT